MLKSVCEEISRHKPTKNCLDRVLNLPSELKEIRNHSLHTYMSSDINLEFAPLLLSFLNANFCKRKMTNVCREDNS